MSSLKIRFWVISVVSAILVGSGLAFAGAVSLEDLANPRLSPSAIPALLGPISEAGRKGWECFPERAAVAKQATAAELPLDGHTP